MAQNDPNPPDHLLRLGRAAIAAGRIEEALRFFQQAAQPGNNPGAFSDLAMALAALGRFDAAVDAAGRAAQLRPDAPELQNNLGNALQMAGNLKNAMEAYRRAIRLRPDYPDAKVNLAHALTADGCFDPAIVLLEEVLAAEPVSLAALMNLGNAFQGKGELDQAIAAFDRAIRLHPDFPDAHSNMALALKDAARLDQAIQHTRRSLELRPDPKIAASLLILLQYHPGYDQAAIATAQREWYSRFVKERFPARSVHGNDPSPDRRLRIGYLSPDFRHHPVGHNILPLLVQHDHSAFEIFCYSNVARPDAFTDRLRQYADHWRDIRSLNDQQAAELIASDGIDVLVDLALHTGENRAEVLARKPAPLQVTFAGYPGTMGLPTIDYRLTDAFLDPIEHDEPAAPERPLHLPSFWCYQPLGEEPEVNALPATSEGFVTFGCLNNFCKVNDEVLELWARVLIAVPASRLVLLAKRGSHRGRTLSLLQSRGVDPDRVWFLDPRPRNEYLKLYHQIDLGLDTFPYNGHTTSLDSLWMGVPVLSLVGTTPRSRAGWSLLSNLDMTPLAAASKDAFVDIARNLAADFTQLARTRETLREHMRRSALTDKTAFARSIESAFRTAWRNWCASPRENRSKHPLPARRQIREALDHAVRHHTSGNLRLAETHYRRILDQSPSEPDALHLLGVVCHQLGRSAEAVNLIDAAIANRPDVADFHTNLGLALLALGRIDPAIAAHRDALGLDPKHAAAHCNLGLALAAAGQNREAIASYQAAISLKADSSEAHFNLGRALHELGELERACEALKLAVLLRPNFAEAYVQLGNILVERGQHAEAMRCFKDALALNPESVEIAYNIANVLTESGRLDEAVTAYRDILARRPDYADAHLNLGKALKERGEWDGVISCYRRAAELAPGPRIEQNLFTSYQYLPDADPVEILRDHCRWNEKYAKPLREDPASQAPHLPGRRLRIGYVSPDFCRHPVGWCILPVLAAHDAAEVEVYCYSDVPASDLITDRIRQCAHTWRDTRRLSDAELAQRVRQDRIDVLVDLAAHTKGSRLLAFARKPAPVQVTWLGWPGTTGMDAMDYRLSDPYLDPPGNPLEPLYAEKTIRLPDSFWCYGRPETDVPVGQLPALGRGITFGSLNALFKSNDRVFEVWAKILSTVPRSRLLMRAPFGVARGRILRKFQELGVDPDRVEFVARVSQADYWAVYQQVDIGLDTFPYNGHTTSMDALWMGLPVVSLVGRLPVARAGLTILSNLGLPDLATASPDLYVRTATELAADPQRLGQLRASLRDRIESSPLMDAPRFARNLQSIYRRLSGQGLE